MKIFFNRFLLMLIASLTLSACSSNSSNSNNDADNNPQQKNNDVDWASVPREFNPDTDSYELDLESTQTIMVDLFSFERNFVLQYSNDLPQNKAKIETYTVYYDNEGYGINSPNSRHEANGVLKVSTGGVYSCSIHIENRHITSLKGACYVKVVLTLPADAPIEVYNLSKLISRRIFAMTNAAFFKALDSASFDKDKDAVIDTYLASYAETGQKPILVAADVSNAIEEMSFKEGKFIALRKLHTYVSDRESLRAVIQDKIPYFEREEALRIVGL